MSAGQVVDTPSQDSAGSHDAIDWRQTTPEESTPSGGQLGLVPEQDSGTSQGPAAGLQTAPVT
jgi:hypothetical protein